MLKRLQKFHFYGIVECCLMSCDLLLFLLLPCRYRRSVSVEVQLGWMTLNRPKITKWMHWWWHQKWSKKFRRSCKNNIESVGKRSQLLDWVKSKLIWNYFLVSQNWCQSDYKNSISAVIFLMQDLVKADIRGEIWNGSSACLVPLLKMRTIVLVTCLPYVIVSSLLYRLVTQSMITG